MAPWGKRSGCSEYPMACSSRRISCLVSLRKEGGGPLNSKGKEKNFPCKVRGGQVNAKKDSVSVPTSGTYGQSDEPTAGSKKKGLK